MSEKRALVLAAAPADGHVAERATQKKGKQEHIFQKHTVYLIFPM
jgi:hypothetical protein